MNPAATADSEKSDTRRRTGGSAYDTARSAWSETLRPWREF